MLRITTSRNIPAGSFVEARDVEPVFGEDELTLFTGTGPLYPWGTTVVASTVVLHDPSLLAIHMRICHRHGTEQCWRYYQRKEASWRRVMWNSLLTSDRLRVFDGYRRQAPAFAVLPGSLPWKSPTDPPSMKIGSTYLLARVEGERYYALKNPEIEYVLGASFPTDQTRPAQVRSYPCRTCLLIKWRAGTLSRRNVMPATLALLECRVGGDVHLSDGKVVSSTLCLERLVEMVGEEC